MNEKQIKTEPITLTAFYRLFKQEKLWLLFGSFPNSAWFRSVKGLIEDVARLNKLWSLTEQRVRVLINLFILRYGQPEPFKKESAMVSLKKFGIKEPFKRYKTIYHTRTRKSAKKLERKLRIAA